MSGTLYIVGTPIGNLGDFSPRAVEILQSVDFIAAEDTRVTLKLLNHFGIKKPMISTTGLSAGRLSASGWKTGKMPRWSAMPGCRPSATRASCW